jgi:hypothetical protein
MAKKLEIKPRVGVKYQSEKYGCYDSMMYPYPTWNIPEEYFVSYYGKKFKCRKEKGKDIIEIP